MEDIKATLMSLRTEIDALDEKILAALEARFNISDRIGKLKSDNNLPVVDKKREEEMLNRWIEISSPFLDKDFLERFLYFILEESKKRQIEK